MTLKRGTLWAVVATLAVTLTLGMATAMAQNLDSDGVTLDPGSDSVRNQLIAEATAQAADEGYDLSWFDFEAAQTGPNGQLLFAPVQSKAQLDSFTEGERSQATAGLLYAKQTFTIQGQEYKAGVHVVKLSRFNDSQSLVNGPVPNHEIDGGPGDDTIIICEEGATCETGSGDQDNNDDSDDDGGGNPVGGPEGVCMEDPIGLGLELCAK